jgi:hypothetical protein
MRNIDFKFEIGFNKKLPSFYSCAFHNLCDQCFLKSEFRNELELSDKIEVVYDIPSYLDVKKRNLSPVTGFKSVIQHKGYCIDLNGYNSLESYLKDRFSSNSRQRLRRRKKRLESCFDISFEMYYGAIDKMHYDELFERFYVMLKYRAEEKGIENDNLKKWDFYTASVYKMILKKEASLFVIYDANKPINIGLNLHLKNTVFLFMSTYDLDYSVFRLGHTNWLLQLDWFIKNDFKLVDFSKGNVAYKKRWANKKYDYSYHLFYEKSTMFIRTKVFWLIKKLQLKQLLRNLGLNIIYYGLLSKLKRTGKFKRKLNYEFINQLQLPDKTTLLLILIREKNKLHIRRFIYNYLYLSSLNINEVEVYKEINSEGSFYISSKKGVVKLVVN